MVHLVTALAILVALISVAYYMLQNGSHSQCGSHQLRALLIGNRRSDDDSLQTARKVFDRAGYCIVEGEKGGEWDVMWSQDFIFEKGANNTKKERQLINHFPTLNFLTNKMHMSVTADSKYVPTSFDFPRLKNEFLYYKKLNMDQQFVVKNFDVGGVKIVEFKDMDYFLGDVKFMQRFVQNPMLIDGRAFDLGVYVLVTSLNPLRMYRWKNDVLLRFCAEPYLPFDAKNVDKYVVSDNHLSLWEIAEFEEITQTFNFSGLEAFNYHLEKLDHDVETFWDQVDDAIVSVTLGKLNSIVRHEDHFIKSQNIIDKSFFELLRFDFLVDEDANVHLMEANMSPNLTPQKDQRESIVYEQLLYNTLSTVGVLTPSEMKPKTTLEDQMHSADKDITVDAETCSECLDSCNDATCELCLPCMAPATIRDFHRAYREHRKRGEFRRIFPTSDYLQNQMMSQLSEKSRLSVKWFYAKCENDDDWC